MKIERYLRNYSASMLDTVRVKIETTLRFIYTINKKEIPTS